MSFQTLAYTPASQLASLTQNSLAYVWQGQPTTTKDSTHTGLNEDAAIAVLPHGYDPNGNYTDNGVRNYTYDEQNRMTFEGDAVTALGVAYDPLGRLRATHTSANVWTYFLYAGDQLIGEYGDKSATQPALWRHVHGDGTDEPLVSYAGNDTSQRRWLHADRQGSIIAWSDVSGAIQATYTYSPYGEPSAWSGSRFLYTGQAALPEVQLHFYKARLYDPVQGRFLQTDPIGQESDPNLYAYVHDDPVDRSDPSGLVDSSCTGALICGGETIHGSGGSEAGPGSVPNAAHPESGAFQVAQNTRVDPNGRGPAGERAAGIDQSAKERIPSRTGTAKYRIPDESKAGHIREVKNVNRFRVTGQIKDFVAEAKASLRTFFLDLDEQTHVPESAQKYLNENDVQVRRLPLGRGGPIVIPPEELITPEEIIIPPL
ncbi:MAG TPA: RHS repeat-associated core domain-containing protein [Phenylobacterium sp.]|uniref:RHS repeat-associated core domain-containing protein n=1 Tax=Phenylobacterium sp. TaxID=1871053 RepID=UPI002C2AB6EF|nr:RHS repeat-associated core domain-containing protein [Phenylobacterium sp.]HXA40259.1 RHS repeat-associated core domain-containing protein [Phenylobacterium sp.]